MHGTTITPVVRVHPLVSGVHRFPAGGAAVTRALFSACRSKVMLSERNPYDWDTVDRSKPALLQACGVHGLQLGDGAQHQLELPGSANCGQCVTLSTEVARDCFEPLFTGPVSYDQSSESNPWYSEAALPGEETLAKAVVKAAAVLYETGNGEPVSVLLAGRGSRRKCMSERLALDLKATTELKCIVTHAELDCSEWIGGTRLTHKDIPTFYHSRDEFEEFGASAVASLPKVVGV